MKLLPRRLALTAALFATLALLAPASAEAQRRGRPIADPDAPWASISGGIRFGYDNDTNGEMMGSFLRIPLLRNGRLELVPSGDVTFLTGLREYQYNTDLVWVTGGPAGGLYAGGGLAWHNTIFEPSPDSPRETLRGYNVLVGVKGSSAGRYAFQLELRWTFISDSQFDPQVVSLGVSFPLTNRAS